LERNWSRAYLREPYPFPACGIERRKDERGYNYIVRWPGKLRFEGEPGEKETVWFNVNKETYAGEAEEACWEYFQEVQKRYARQGLRGEATGHPDGFGPFEGKYGEHMWFHGTSGDHVFPGGEATVRRWDEPKQQAGDPELEPG
jgi:hypothetical protein